MPRRGAELAATDRSLDLSRIAQSLHEIAEQLGQADTLVRADAQNNGRHEHTSESVATSHQRSHSRSAATSHPRFHTSDQETPRDGRCHYPDDSGLISQNDCAKCTDPYGCRPTQSSHETYANVAPQFRHNRPGQVHHTFSPRIVPRSRTNESVSGRSILSNPSPPPTPTPLRHHVPGITATVSTAPDRHQNDHVSPEADNIYVLNEGLVQCRIASRRVIHKPPFGEEGSQGRWYYVTRGTQVGIFNDWAEVQKATSGVSGSHQQRVKTEALAYTYFQRALLQGRVEVIV